MSHITFRPATHRDHGALARLAELDSARPLSGPVLVAESCGELVAAQSLDTGRTIADPFRFTAGTVQAMRTMAF